MSEKIAPDNLEIQWWETTRPIPYRNNARKIPQKAIDVVAESIKEFGWKQPLVVNAEGVIIVGHTRLLAAQKLGLEQVPVTVAYLDDEKERLYRLADNKTGEFTEWDMDILAQEIIDLNKGGIDIPDMSLGTAFEVPELNTLLTHFDDHYSEGQKGQMGKDFGISPFTILNAREGAWQQRKKFWIEKGIKSELGRDLDVTVASDDINRGNSEGGSVFDPVLCELAYKWFSPAGGTVLDPFAGGSVRGLVASYCDRKYYGCDLRQEQIEANIEQAKDVDAYRPQWKWGDSQEIDKHYHALKADLVFSCPPYADLEVYSDQENDLSNMSYPDFLAAYKTIIEKCFNMLNDDSFAVWVVGDVRDKNGNYRNFVGHTINAFMSAGFNYYNEAILITPVGSLPLRAGKSMRATRKLGKTHQNVLVFVKGDGKAAAARCGDIEIDFAMDEDKDDTLVLDPDDPASEFGDVVA